MPGSLVRGAGWVLTRWAQTPGSGHNVLVSSPLLRHSLPPVLLGLGSWNS